MTTRDMLRGLASALAACLLSACTSAGGLTLPANPDQTHAGRTYGEWAAAWWQWVFAQTAAHHPLMDTTGEDAALGQHGDVWFLGASFGDPAFVTRDITIPSGTALFFPLFNFEEDSVFAPGMSVPDMQAELDGFVGEVTALTLRIDGVAVPNLMQLRAASRGSFSAALPPADDLFAFFGIADAPRTVPTMVADGFWAFVEPLKKGLHTIEFGGTQTSGPDVFTLQATYHVTVE